MFSSEKNRGIDLRSNKKDQQKLYNKPQQISPIRLYSNKAEQSKMTKTTFNDNKMIKTGIKQRFKYDSFEAEIVNKTENHRKLSHGIKEQSNGEN